MLLQLLPLLLVMVTDPAPAADPRRATVSMADETARLLLTSERRVRSADPRLVRLIDEGVERSYSFAELVRDLHYTDVIIYVEAVHGLPAFVEGHTFLVPSHDTQRYLRIQVRQGLPPDETIALLAHELRHALEVARDPAVKTPGDLAQFYKRIGQPVAGLSNRFDTRAAQEMGRMVRRELR